MRIAYVSFEYPPDSAFGGIATYVWQVSRLMAARGHDVEVFCSSPDRNISEKKDGCHVHRVKCSDRNTFRMDILEIFKSRHLQEKFDILESPEYYADGLDIKQQFRSLPLIVKLHTPRFLIHELTYRHVPLPVKIRFMAGGLKKGRLAKQFWKWHEKKDDIDYQICLLADQIHTPSISLGQIVTKRWHLDSAKIINVPYPFLPNQRLLDIPIERRDTQVFTFIGRLELRKGILELLPAAALVLQKLPASRLLFVGATQESHIAGKSMQQYIIEKLAEFSDRIQFRQVTNDQIPEILDQTDVCVFPSLWENFPNVCLEAMSAGRAIVASREGGMKDMLAEPEAGLLVDPLDEQLVAKQITALLCKPDLRMRLGTAARKKLLSAYSNEVIGTLMETYYSRVN